ncbi:MAG: hypothetical protein ACOYVK_20995 [Bacillota bacterium]
MKIFSKVKNWLSNKWFTLIYPFKKPKLKVIQLQLSGDGRFIDVRYWLSRPDKMKKTTEIYLIDEESGIKCSLVKIPKYGYVRTRHRYKRSMGILLFHNLDNTIRYGSKVTLFLGPFRLEHMEVSRKSCQYTSE